MGSRTWRSRRRGSIVSIMMQIIIEALYIHICIPFFGGLVLYLHRSDCDICKQLTVWTTRLCLPMRHVFVRFSSCLFCLFAFWELNSSFDPVGWVLTGIMPPFSVSFVMGFTLTSLRWSWYIHLTEWRVQVCLCAYSLLHSSENFALVMR